MRTAAVLAAFLALGGCVSAADSPSADVEGYPNLRDVPRTTIANTNPDHWAQVETEMAQARADLKDSPRSEPAPPQGTDEFVNQARQELEESRQAHPE